MNTKPLVSILTPAYNAETSIGKAIDSVIAQTYPNWELLIINDGSTDETGEIANSYSDSRIRYYQQKNNGVSFARNIALENMNGDFFCFLDADDFLPSRSIESRLQCFEFDNSIEFVDGLVHCFQEDESKYISIVKCYQPSFTGNPFKELISLKSSCFFGPSWMIRVNKNKKYRFLNGLTHAEDLLFYITIAKSGVYSYTETPVYHYRVSNNSAMSDLIGLEKGYKTVLEEISKIEGVLPDEIRYFRKKCKSIMFKSFLKKGMVRRAFKQLLN